MKVNEMRNLTREDLMQKLNSLSQELLKLNYQKRIGGLEKPHRFMSVRKDIARVKTILREQKLNQKAKESK